MRKKMKSFRLFRDKKAKDWKESLREGADFFRDNKQSVLLFLLGFASFPILLFSVVSLKMGTTNLIRGIEFQQSIVSPNSFRFEQKSSFGPNVDHRKNRSIGGDRDEHGCYVAAGYTWCQSKNKCLRTWEESCAN